MYQIEEEDKQLTSTVLKALRNEVYGGFQPK